MPNLFDAAKRPSDDDFLQGEEQTALIARIEELTEDPNLNAWEQEFLDSCLTRVQGGPGIVRKAV